MAKAAGPNPNDPHPRDRGPAPGADVTIALAKRVTDATGDPDVGGVAVMLHGGGRTTYDIDIYADDFKRSSARLIAAGIPWDARRREHLIDGVGVRMVAEDSLGGPPAHVSVIRGVRVIGLADLVRGKLTVGLEAVHRAKDLAHVIDFIQRVPLTKAFAAKLPQHLRAPFNTLVEQASGSRRYTPIPPTTFLRKYA